jgi:hypothetical protein
MHEIFMTPGTGILGLPIKTLGLAPVEIASVDCSPPPFVSYSALES